jgi:predicted dehydrogenase
MNGRDFSVEVPTHISSYLKFANGVEMDGFFSFDGQLDPAHPHIEIVGTTGRLRLADPNSYEESRLILSRGKGIWWEEVELERKAIDYTRGIGLADFARGSSRFTADMPLHILEAMDAAYQVNNTGKTYRMSTTMDRPDQF